MTHRFGIEVRLGLAMVPAFAPVGWDAADYERHVAGPEPLPEVLAWHAANWPDVTRFADFADHLDLSAWDPTSWAELAADAGAGWLDVTTDEHHDWSAQRAGLVTAAAKLDLRRATPSQPTEAAGDRQLVRRGLGVSTMWSQVESDDDRLDAAGLVDVLTGAVAQGGSLQLRLGPAPDGSVPTPVAATLRAAGGWARRHHEAIAGVEPFDVWGDAEVRYTARPGDEPGTRVVYVIDLTGAPVREIAHFSPHRYPIEAVEGAADWSQGLAGVRLVANPARPHSPDAPVATVHRLTIRDKRARVLAVTGERAAAGVRIADRTFPTLAAALAAAVPGDQIDLPAARYGSPGVVFPLVLPAGVTLAGVPTDDPTADPPTLDGRDLPFETPLIRLADDAGVEGLTLLGPTTPRTSDGSGSDSPVVVSEGAQRTVVERCVLHGSVVHQGGADHAVSFNALLGGEVRATDADRVTVTGNRISESPLRPVDSLATGAGVVVRGGAEHRIDANTITGVDTGIRLVGSTDATVASNAAHARRWAIHLDHCDGADVSGNQCRGGRAFTITGGNDNHVMANIADGTDTGLLLEAGAGATVASANQFVGCRVGILSWSHHASALDPNRFTDCVTRQVH